MSEGYSPILQLYNVDKKNLTHRKWASGGRWVQEKIRFSEIVGLFNDTRFAAFSRVVDGTSHTLFNRIIPSGQKWPSLRKGVIALADVPMTIEKLQSDWSPYSKPEEGDKKSLLVERADGQATRGNNAHTSSSHSPEGPGG